MGLLKKQRWVWACAAMTLLFTASACTLLRGSELDQLEERGSDAGGLAPAKDANSGGGGDGQTGAESSTATSCPASMVEERFKDGTRFCIDRTEVTQAEYAKFVAVDGGSVGPPLACKDGLNTPLAPHGDNNCADGGAFNPTTLADLPVVCIDHCNAAYYCAWRGGARLCGMKGGSVLDPEKVNDEARDEWFVACRGGNGSRTFARGEDPAGCVFNRAGGPVAANDQGCSTPEGVAHLSGNVEEWTAACGASSSGEIRCLTRGGAFNDTSATAIRCEQSTTDGNVVRQVTARTVFVGFRCCQDAL